MQHLNEYIRVLNVQNAERGILVQDFLRSWRFKVLAAVCIVLIAFMLRAAYTGGLGTIVSNTLGFITTPLQKVSATISDAATGFFETYLRAGAIKDENTELKAQIRELQKQLVDYDELKQKNEQYKEFLNIKERNQDFEFQPASIIGRDPNARFYSFTIDVGSLDGISLYDPVMTADGLVGIVYETAANFSKVRTILDVSTDVGVYNPRTMDTGVVTGDISLYEDGLCRMMYVSRESKIQEGDLIVTSGISGIFPKEIPVGQVKSVHPESHGMSLYCVIEPSVNIKDIKDVFVIKSFSGQGSELTAEESAADEKTAEGENK